MCVFVYNDSNFAVTRISYRGARMLEFSATQASDRLGSIRVTSRRVMIIRNFLARVNVFVFLLYENESYFKLEDHNRA